jgi:outer membrane lipoprotein-sorting protein
LPNGRLLTECDFRSLVQGLAKEITAGEKATASSVALNLTHQPGKAIVLETQEPGQGTDFINQRILIDPKINIPTRWLGFKNGQLLYSVKFEDLKLDLDLADDMFNL